MLSAMWSAVEALEPALALGLAPLRVNDFTPGLIDTPLLHTADGPKCDTIIQKRVAIFSGKRVGTADAVAPVILTLVTNAYITGEVVHVDGSNRFVSHRSSDSPTMTDGTCLQQGWRVCVCQEAGEGQTDLLGHGMPVSRRRRSVAAR